MATSWRVGDRSAVGLIDRFYRELAEGRPVVETLRQAKLAAIREGTSPRVWAAFGVVGDPLVTVPLRVPAAAWGWWVAGVAVLLAGVGVVWRTPGRRGGRGRRA